MSSRFPPWRCAGSRASSWNLADDTSEVILRHASRLASREEGVLPYQPQRHHRPRAIRLFARAIVGALPSRSFTLGSSIDSHLTSPSTRRFRGHCLGVLRCASEMVVRGKEGDRDRRGYVSQAVVWPHGFLTALISRYHSERLGPVPALRVVQPLPLVRIPEPFD
jgi:hypothetical protein